jgi:hypothetical protein
MVCSLEDFSENASTNLLAHKLRGVYPAALAKAILALC